MQHGRLAWRNVEQENGRAFVPGILWRRVTSSAEIGVRCRAGTATSQSNIAGASTFIMCVDYSVFVKLRSFPEEIENAGVRVTPCTMSQASS